MGATTNGISQYIKDCFIDCLPEVIILYLGANNLLRNASADDIASKIVALERSIKIEYYGLPKQAIPLQIF